MWVDPPNRLDTLPFAPWLSQTTAGGQRSGLAFLCPNPPWVPTYPLSRGSPSAVTHATSACSFFLPISVLSPPTPHKPSFASSGTQCLTLSPFVIFSTLFFVFWPCFALLLPSSLVNSWVDVPGREATPPFSCSFCLSLLLSLHSSLPVLCPAVALEGSVYPAAAEAGFICPRASPWKGIFHLWRLAHCLRWHWVPNCATSKFGILVL